MQGFNRIPSRFVYQPSGNIIIIITIIIIIITIIITIIIIFDPLSLPLTPLHQYLPLRLPLLHHQITIIAIITTGLAGKHCKFPESS